VEFGLLVSLVLVDWRRSQSLATAVMMSIWGADGQFGFLDMGALGLLL